MNITIICVGKIKENYIKEAIRDYYKRICKYVSLNIIEVENESISSENLSTKYKKLEGYKILKLIKPSSFVITLEIEGKQLSSLDFATKIKNISNKGINEISFIIGGANGLDDEVSKKSDLKLSISKMTFTHQMVRPILLEQIYRCFKIINNESYHR